MTDTISTWTSLTTMNVTSNPSTTAVTEIVFSDMAQRITVACLFCIIGGLGLVGNTVVIVAVAMSRRLQTPTNVFVISLSLSDLLTSLGLPFQAVGVLSDHGWPLPESVCATVAASAMMSLTCSVTCLTIIAVNRFALITRARRTYLRLFTTRRNIIYSILSWLFPLLVFIIPQAAGYGRLGYEPTFKLCAWDTSHHLADIYEIMAALLFFVATLIITVTYTTIYVFIRRHTTVMQHHVANKLNQVTDQSCNPTSQPPEVREAFAESKKDLSRRDIDITINLFYIVCIFYLCIIPYGFALALTNTGSYSVYAGMLFVLNSAINPFIYARKHPNFKVVMKCIATCQFHAIPEPASWLRSML
ncbi:beta-3 adrenergic receptor-like [Diadema setosum]|uniref:beta-3 adrenergic receptor-like n=1 Tax=Diadema setosum TaxID=31175 RepID=UPI003B3B2A28